MRSTPIAALVLLAVTSPLRAEEAPAPQAGAEAPVAEAPSGEAVAEAKPAPLAGYDGGFFVQSEDESFLIEIGAKLQTRYTAEYAQAPGKDEITSSIAIRRAQVQLGGHLFTKKLRWGFQAEFAKGAALDDYWLEYEAVDGALSVRAGRYKMPYSRHQLASDGQFALVDRAVTDKAFLNGRDVGVMVHHKTGKGAPLEYALGVFQGGDGQVFGPVIVGRVAYHSEKFGAYKEPDFDKGPLRWGVGGSMLIDVGIDDPAERALQMEVDAILKVAGFTGLAEVQVSSRPESPTSLAPTLDAVGLLVQGSYTIGERFAPAARYALVLSPDRGDVHELAVGGAAFLFRTNAMIKTDVALLLPEDTGYAPDVRWRVEAQLAF